MGAAHSGTSKNMNTNTVHTSGQRSILAGLLLGICMLLWPVTMLASGTKAEQFHAALMNGVNGPVIIASHRADWRNYPENSLPAIEGSISLGVEIAEIDLQRTKDGELILMHDTAIDRTTTGKGLVADHTLAEIRSLYLRDGLGSPTRFVVPTLREALLAARGRILLNLDKSYRYFPQVMALLVETGTTENVLVKGPGTVAEVQAGCPEMLTKVAYMPVVNFTKPGAAGFVQTWLNSAKPCAIEFVFEEWTPELAQAFTLCRDQGVRIWVNTLWPQLAGGLSDDQALKDPDGVYGLMLDRGVTMFQTDRPVLLQHFLATRKGTAHSR